MSKLRLTQSTIEKLQHYVYLLIDPRNNEIFYVGKGLRNRIYSHIEGSLIKELEETEKNKRLKEIKKTGLKIQHTILRHGLSMKEAFEVESAAIDLIGLNNLTNKVKGHHSHVRGIADLNELKIRYEAEEANIVHPVILINIKRLFLKSHTAKELYESTRKEWRLNKARAQKAEYAFCTYLGIIREVYQINTWSKSIKCEGRYIFEGRIASETIREKYLNKSVKYLWKPGSQNPIKYINI